jgi:hypothetical protein
LCRRETDGFFFQFDGIIIQGLKPMDRESDCTCNALNALGGKTKTEELKKEPRNSSSCYVFTLNVVGIFIPALVVMGDFKDFPNFDRPSLECLVSVLDNYGRDEDSKDEEGITITELVLANVHLKEPSDGGVNVFKAFFTRSDTTLTKVTLQWSDFGSQQDTSQLIAAFETNRTVTDLSILGIRDLYGSALGSSLSGLMRNMPQLQRLECRLLSVEEVRAFQPGLQANQKLKELSFHCCYNMGDEGIRLIADALVGNTTMDTLDICENRITPVGLDDITRLIESTQLKKVTLWCRRETFTINI